MDLDFIRDYRRDLEEINMFRPLKNTRPRKIKIYKTHINPMQDISEEEFRLRYMFSKANISRIFDLLRPDLKMDTRGGSIPVELQIMAVIRYWGGHESQKDCADIHGMSQQTLSRLALKVAMALASKSAHYIKMPSTMDEEATTIHKFQSICGLCGINGAVDCTQIKLRNTDELLNTQIVCDANLRICDLVCHQSDHIDHAKIFSESSIHRRFEENEFVGKLIAGIDYACTPNLITPILQPVNEEQHRFNTQHLQAHNVVERCFEVWKNKFHILMHMRGSYATVKITIVACAVLHNLDILYKKKPGVVINEQAILEIKCFPSLARLDNMNIERAAQEKKIPLVLKDGKLEMNKNHNYYYQVITVKLGTKTVERFLTLADDNFVDDVNDDLKCFLSDGGRDRVLVFPPVSNYRRFLIHKCVEQLQRPDLHTFSIGVCSERRTVLCYTHQLLSDEACARPVMGLTQTDRDNAAISHNEAVGDCKQTQRRAQPQEKIRSGSTRPRRPDRAVYVPRALRATDQPHEDKPEATKRTAPEAKCPKSPAPRDKSAHGTPRKSIDKNFCNVYTPPHLRNQRSHTAPSIEDKPREPESADFPVPNSDSAIPYSDNSYNEEGESFYIGDYFANGQLGFYHPDYYAEYANGDPNRAVWRTNEAEENMALNETQSNIIDSEYIYSKDEDVEKNELKRASQEINRSSKRIIKQSFHSDVLVISDPAENETEPIQTAPAPQVPQEEEKQLEPKKTKPKLEPKLSLKREENDWDAVFDDSGECLDPSLLEELTSTVGKVHISKAKNNYDQYQTKGQQLLSGPYDEAFGHVVEVYDFPSEFKTNDLLSLFSEYKDTGFEIKWVDDTHALIVFSSAKIAAEVLSTQRMLGKCRPLHAATLESRNKAKKCAEFLQPYRQRPETCTALARRLVSGALGVRLSTARQERAEERRLITIAKEKKRQAALHKEAAWDGSLADHTLDT